MNEYKVIKIKEYSKIQNEYNKFFKKISFSNIILFLIYLIVLFIFICAFLRIHSFKEIKNNKNNTEISKSIQIHKLSMNNIKNNVNINNYNESFNILIELNKMKQKFLNSININDSLYYLEKKPKISIIIPLFDGIQEKDDLKILMIKTILNQSLNDIEILLSFSQNNSYLFNKIKELSNIFTYIKYFKSESDIYNDTKKLLLESNGKFITVFYNYINIKDIHLLESIYYDTFGKINYLYEFFIENEKKYLIKNKIIKDTYDNDLNFNNFNELVEYIKLKKVQDLNYISISFALDNKYALSGYVSMISILETKNYNTYISFYVLVSKNFTNDYKYIILSLYEQYDYLNFTFIYMDDRYNKIKVINYLNQIAYYRLSLGELLPYKNKILYLDSDIIVYNDLTNLFNLNFNGKLMLARKIPKEIKGAYQINSGVLLLNLKKMRENKFEQNVLKIIDNGFVSNIQDQGLLIKYYLNDIGVLSEKYNVLTQGFDSLINFYNKRNLTYKKDDLIYISKYPFIRHFNGHNKKSNKNYLFDWWYFAKKGKYYSLILKNKLF